MGVDDRNGESRGETKVFDKTSNVIQGVCENALVYYSLRTYMRRQTFQKELFSQPEASHLLLIYIKILQTPRQNRAQTLVDATTEYPSDAHFLIFHRHWLVNTRD